MQDPLPRTEAVKRVARLRPTLLGCLSIEEVPIDDLRGRTVAAEIVAEADRPAHDHATMDGYAFAADDTGPLEVIDEQVYPESDPPELAKGQALRIATGAPLPARADTVVKVEDATVADGELDHPNLPRGTYVYERGSNVRAGDRLYTAGERLSPMDAILLRDLGHDSLEVHARARVAILATGTEIHEGKIHDLDSAMLSNLVRSWGHEPELVGSVPDDRDHVRARVSRLGDEYDAVMTTGGTSVGPTDYVIDALDHLGEVLFHRVAIRPGKPIAVARLAQSNAIAIAIPGKPIGAFVSAAFVARPLFTGHTSLPSRTIELTRDVGLGPPGFEYVIPVSLSDDRAMPLGHIDSPLAIYRDTFDPSVVSSSTRAATADGVVITTEELVAGETVEVVPIEAVA